MKILIWVATPIVLTVLAWIAYRIANRPDAPLTPEASMLAHQRFLQVLETPVPAPTPSRWAGSQARGRTTPPPPPAPSDRMSSQR